MGSIRLHFACTLALSLVGCTFVNQPLNDLDTPVDRRQINRTRAAIIRTNDAAPPATHAGVRDGWFVGLAISGGGSRSANFAAGVMFELQRIGLLQKVDAISSVSGGSLTAAYYCISDDTRWTVGNVQRLLSHPFAADMWWQFVQPWNTTALALTDWDRSDLLADSFNRTLFRQDGKTLTFGDLRTDRPRLLVNSTDLQSGQRFVFANEYFNDINSNLSIYPVAYAVAASSSVPVVLHQVTLRDYSSSFKQYRHFVDGGIVDNLGVLTLLETYKSSNDHAARTKQEVPYPRGSIIVIIDAGTQFNARLSEKGDVGLVEGLGTGAKLSTAKLLARASSATLADMIVQYAPADMTADQLREKLVELQQTGIIQTKDRDGRPMTIIHVALSRAATLRNPPFQSFGASLNAIDTYFNIAPADAHNLYQAAGLIIKEQFEEQLTQIKQTVDAK